MAARSFAPADCAAVEISMGGSLRPGPDLHYCATGNFPVDVALERAGQIGEGDGPRDDALQVARRAVAGDATPHREPLRAPGRGGVDAEQVHSTQDEREHRRLERR